MSNLQIQSLTVNGTTYDIVDNTSGYMKGMTILSYGNSTWQDFITAYNENKVVYCRASSNSNPATGAQTRLAFMAYVNSATPTEVEFQYYRSVSAHTESQQGDQVFVYKLTSAGTWTVTTRETSAKVVAGTGLGSTYSNDTITLTGPTKVSDLTNDSGFISTETDPTVPSWAKASTKPTYTFSEIGSTPTTLSGYGITDAKIENGTITLGSNSITPLTSFTETDPIFTASAAYGISSSDITSWNGKQDALVSGTNIKTINSTSILGSGDISITDNKVAQSASTSNSPQPILFRNNVGTSASDSTEGTRYVTSVTITPNTGDIEATKFNGYTLAGACAKTVDTSISANSSSANLPTSSAVASFVEGKGYITGYTETDPVFVASAAYGITSSDITSWDGKQAALVSGTNIKTINNTSLLGSGNIDIQSAVQNVWYSTCSTTATTNTKVVTTTSGDFAGNIGDTVIVMFTNGIAYADSIDLVIDGLEYSLYGVSPTFNQESEYEVSTTVTFVVTDDGYVSMIDNYVGLYAEYLEYEKQDKLISGTNIKTINNTSILGSGDLTVTGGTQVQLVRWS